MKRKSNHSCLGATFSYTPVYCGPIPYCLTVTFLSWLLHYCLSSPVPFITIPFLYCLYHPLLYAIFQDHPLLPIYSATLTSAHHLSCPLLPYRFKLVLYDHLQCSPDLYCLYAALYYYHLYSCPLLPLYEIKLLPLHMKTSIRAILLWTPFMQANTKSSILIKIEKLLWCD